jgi:hypothetical protein
MTEAGWLRGNRVIESDGMLEHVLSIGLPATRKLRFVVLNCYRLVICHEHNEVYEHVFDLYEQCIDGIINRRKAEETIRQVIDPWVHVDIGLLSSIVPPRPVPMHHAWWVRMVEWFTQQPQVPGTPSRVAEERVESTIEFILRELFGNPFRPVTLDPRWLTSTVLDLARTIYEGDPRQAGGYMSGLPILADALMDAGCDDEQILGHCRGPGPHVRGCWVVDLLLGKG